VCVCVCVCGDPGARLEPYEGLAVVCMWVCSFHRAWYAIIKSGAIGSATFLNIHLYLSGLVSIS